MSTSNNSRITLEIETGADPIRGLIEHSDGSREPFWGWLELMDELRRVAADKPERAPPGQPQPEPARRASPARQTKPQKPHRSTKEQS